VHRSRLKTIVIDCNEAAYEKGVAFWSAALGLQPTPEDERYTVLAGSPDRVGPLQLLVQRVSDEHAFHLDIESDDVEAEVARLEKLGAVRKYKIRTWWVMRAPTGHDFCVVRPQTPDFAHAPANRWDDGSGG
jgi:Glyoxalase-like domain